MDIQTLIRKEKQYQQQQLKLIPSENYTSKAVMEAVGSVFMNKYAEGQAGKRYYQGNQNADSVELECKQRALELYNLTDSPWSVNVQAVTGAIANLSVYTALLKPHDRMLSLSLPDGGHLSHGWQLPDGTPVSLTSQLYEPHFYHVSLDNYLFDYDEIEKQAHKVKPAIIISGGTAYPHIINFKRLSEIAHRVGALYMADVAHEAGLIAGKAYPSPFPYADVVTMTTRKTLRGPIGALIFTKDPKLAEKVDRAVFPGLQGGPMINSIAGIAVALGEAATPEFSEYARQIVKNASVLAKELFLLGFDIVSGGTDTHLILVDIQNKQPDGLIAAKMLETADIIVNKNTIPIDLKNSALQAPWRPAGIRLGTPAVTTRGMREVDMKTIALLIDKTLSAVSIPTGTSAKDVERICSNSDVIAAIQNKVHQFTDQFPIYE